MPGIKEESKERERDPSRAGDRDIYIYRISRRCVTPISFNRFVEGIALIFFEAVSSRRRILGPDLHDCIREPITRAPAVSLLPENYMSLIDDEGDG